MSRVPCRSGSSLDGLSDAAGPSSPMLQRAVTTGSVHPLRLPEGAFPAASDVRSLQRRAVGWAPPAAALETQVSPAGGTSDTFCGTCHALGLKSALTCISASAFRVHGQHLSGQLTAGNPHMAVTWHEFTVLHERLPVTSAQAKAVFVQAVPASALRMRSAPPQLQQAIGSGLPTGSVRLLRRQDEVRLQLGGDRA